MRRRLCPLFWLALPAALAHAANDVPDWVKQAASATLPSYPAKVTNVTLLREEAVTVDVDGHRVMRERGVIRVLQAGADKIAAHRAYDSKTGRIRDFQGWLIPPLGKPIPYAKNRVLDIAVAQGEVYDEYRAKVLELGDARPGSVFAWEVIEEERSIFTQDEYGFQERSPVLVSRFTLTLPAAWEAKGVVINADKQEPKISGSTYTWEMRNLPWREREDYSPALDALVPRLLVSYFPPSDNRQGLKGLKDWTEVSSWMSTLVEPAADATEAVRAKARQLTAGATTELDRIRAIAAFTQHTKYVEIALNLTRGGGYTPHRAEETLARNYGDCKDKATLMRALLKTLDIESYLVNISADDRDYVHPEWASPTQFNHAIVAVHVSDAVNLATVLPDTPLGRLLIFDPTDPITSVGDLPKEEQGSHALVIAGARGALLAMPQLPASANRIESTVEASVDAFGRLDAQIQRQYFGQSAVPLRGVETYLGGDELKTLFEKGFARRIGATTVRRVTTDTHPEDNRLTVSVDVGSERFAQNMQGNLYVVRPGMLASGGEYFLPLKPRTSPVKLGADLRHDTIRIHMPQGFKLDELPGPVKVTSPYGELDAEWTVSGAEIVMKQTLEIRGKVAGPSEYADIRGFFDKLAGAEDAPIVFVKQ